MRTLFFYAITFLGTFSLTAQNCNCDLTLNNLSATNLNLIWASQLNYSPGDKICIPAGTYRGIRFYDLVGTAGNPVEITNCGGKVIIDEPAYPGVSFQRSQYLKFSGSGDVNEVYGIEIADTGNYAVGIYVENLSSDVEINNIEISGAGFAGIMGKTDPWCGNPATWRSSGYVLDNLKIHHNYIHNTGGEGIYLGFTGGYKIQSNRICNGTPIFGHWLDNLEIYDNILEDIGWDGIQVNLGRQNCKIYNNYISDYGTKNVHFQNFAMSIGGGVYEIYNNEMVNLPGGDGQGIQLISGDSGTKIYNNVIVNPHFHGMFLHQRHEFEDVNEGFYIANNTIVEPEDSGVFYNTIITVTDDPAMLYQPQSGVPSYFVNNLVVDPGNDYEGSGTWKQDQESYFDFNTRATRDSLLSNIYTNIMTRDMDTLGLVDTANGNYEPATSSSSLVGVGSDLTTWGITFDFLNLPRPSGSNFDIGAYEFQWGGGTSLQAQLPEANELYDISNINEIETLFYPNPARFHFRLENSDYSKPTLQLFSLSGQKLYEGIYNMGEPFSVANFNPGLYFVRISSGLKTEAHRLIIR